MELHKWIILGALVLVSLLFVLLQQFLERRNRRRLLSSREVLPDHELSARFDPAQAGAPSILFILNEVAERLRVDRGRLRPDDTLESLLGISPRIGLPTDLADMHEDLICAFVPSDKWDATYKLETLGEFVVFVAREAALTWETDASKKAGADLKGRLP